MNARGYYGTRMGADPMQPALPPDVEKRIDVAGNVAGWGFAILGALSVGYLWNRFKGKKTPRFSW